MEKNDGGRQGGAPLDRDEKKKSHPDLVTTFSLFFLAVSFLRCHCPLELIYARKLLLFPFDVYERARSCLIDLSRKEHSNYSQRSFSLGTPPRICLTNLNLFDGIWYSTCFFSILTLPSGV
jgi:hypothetical protein